jgi:hypothetical protein
VFAQVEGAALEQLFTTDYRPVLPDANWRGTMTIDPNHRMNSTNSRHGRSDFAPDWRIEIGLDDRADTLDRAVGPEWIGIVRRERVLVETEDDKATTVIGQRSNITPEFCPVLGVLEIAPTLVLYF